MSISCLSRLIPIVSKEKQIVKPAWYMYPLFDIFYLLVMLFILFYFFGQFMKDKTSCCKENKERKGERVKIEKEKRGV
jgi:hypothetical protein